MRKSKMVTTKAENLSKKALIVSEEILMCELLSLLLEDLGFESVLTRQSKWLPETTAQVNPELIVWDLGCERELNPFQSLSEMREEIYMKKVKIMLLGGLDVKKDMEASVGNARLHFCLTPFSPTKFRYEIEQLYREED